MTPSKVFLMLDSGLVTIRLRRDLAPRHVERVCQLAHEGFYDDAPFGRVNLEFMAQITMPGPSPFPDLEAEFSDVRHVRGTVAMARDVDPDSANCEFFIVVNDAAFSPCQYTVWGEVIEGIGHLDLLPAGEPPAAPGRIISMTTGQ
jgi:peptidylprolyl isomerase